MKEAPKDKTESQNIEYNQVTQELAPQVQQTCPPDNEDMKKSTFATCQTVFDRTKVPEELRVSADPSDDQERVLSLAGSKESLLLQTLRGGKYSNRPPSPLVATGPHDIAAPREHNGGLRHRAKAFDQ